MAVKLNGRAYRYARKLIDAGRFVRDGRDDWSEHRPTAKQENAFIAEHEFGEYRKWFLGVDEEEPENSKERFKFPYGDFERIHRCAVLSVEVRAAQYKHLDIEVAAAHLHGLLDATRPAPT